MMATVRRDQKFDRIIDDNDNDCDVDEDNDGNIDDNDNDGDVDEVDDGNNDDNDHRMIIMLIIVLFTIEHFSG